MKTSLGIHLNLFVFSLLYSQNNLHLDFIWENEYSSINFSISFFVCLFVCLEGGMRRTELCKFSFFSAYERVINIHAITSFIRLGFIKVAVCYSFVPDILSIPLLFCLFLWKDSRVFTILNGILFWKICKRKLSNCVLSCFSIKIIVWMK